MTDPTFTAPLPVVGEKPWAPKILAAINEVKTDVAAAFPTKVDKSATAANVRDFGALGDGTTDDSTAIRAALATGRPVYVPDGTFIVAKDGSNAWALSLPAGARLYGPGTLKLKASSAVSTRLIRINGDDVTIEGLTIDGNSANQSVESNEQRHGIMTGCKRILISNVFITGCAGDAILCTDGTEDVRIVNVRTDNCQRNGITLYGSIASTVACRNVTIMGCHLVATVQPIDSEPSLGTMSNIRIIGNYLQSDSDGSGYALTMGATSTENPAEDYRVIGNTMIGAVYLINCKNVAIIGNYVDATNALDANTNALWNQYRGQDIIVSGNTFLGGSDGRDVINLAQSGGLRPSGYIVENNVIVARGNGKGVNAMGLGPVTIRGNTIRGANSSSSGVYVQATRDMESVIIESNIVEGFATGIYIAPFSTYNINMLRVCGNLIDNREAVPVATYGVRLAGAVAQYLNTFMDGNQVSAAYTTKEDQSTVLVRTGGSAIRPQYVGSGAPESVVTGAIGSLFLRRDGSTSTTLYVKQSGTGNTGWVAK